MFQVYITEAECRCRSSVQQPDCPCFTKTNKKVPLRVSPAQKMFSRLWFLNNNAEVANLETNMRLRDARLYLRQSTDPFVLRYEKLWYKKTSNFAKEADCDIIKIAERLKLDFAQPATTLTQETTRLMVDEYDDVESQRSHIRERTYNLEENSAKQQLLNYNSQSDASFQEKVFQNE